MIHSVKLFFFFIVCPAFGQYSDAGKKIVMEGNQSGGLPCITCHLENGEGMQEYGFPQLSGLHNNYLIKQLKDYQSLLRKHDVMNPIAKGLTEKEIRDVAAYFANLPSVKKVEKSLSADLFEKGKIIAERGLWDKNVPACFSCHGPGGSGVGEIFPPLINQGKIYLEQSLLAFKNKTRQNDPQALMRTIALKLTKNEIKAVVEYLSTLEEPSAQEVK